MRQFLLTENDVFPRLGDGNVMGVQTKGYGSVRLSGHPELKACKSSMRYATGQQQRGIQTASLGGSKMTK